MLCSNPVATTDSGADPLTESIGTRRRRRANAEGGLWHDQRRGRWVGTATVGYDDTGRQVRRSVTARTKSEAAARLRELQGSVEAGQDLARRDLTVARFLHTWVDDVLPGSVAPGDRAAVLATSSGSTSSRTSDRGGSGPCRPGMSRRWSVPSRPKAGRPTLAG